MLILLLVAQLTYLQVVDANNLAHDKRNVRKRAEGLQPDRGEILTADGSIVAQSVPTTAISSTCASTRRAGCSRTPRGTSRSSIWWD